MPDVPSRPSPSRPTQRTPEARRTRPLALVSVVAAAVIVSAFVGFSKELIRRYRINKDIRQAREQIADLEKHNNDLSYLVDYLQTDSFKEIQARQNLGLQKPGETAVLLDESSPTGNGTGATVAFGDPAADVSGVDGSSPSASIAADVSQAAAPAPSVAGNILAWWRYFFGGPGQ